MNSEAARAPFAIALEHVGPPVYRLIGPDGAHEFMDDTVIRQNMHKSSNDDASVDGEPVPIGRSGHWSVECGSTVYKNCKIALGKRRRVISRHSL